MRRATAALALSMAVGVASEAEARAQPPDDTNAPPPVEPAPAPSSTGEGAPGSAPEAPEGGGVRPPSPDEGPPPPVPAPAPSAMPAPSLPRTPPGEATPPATLGEATTTPPEHAFEARGPAAPAPSGLALGVELDAGMTAGARFPESQALRSVEEAVDGTFGASVWLGGRGAVYGLSLERTGLGKDHYATDAMGQTMEATYGVDSLSLLGRWYFSKERPAMYLGLSFGAALPYERSTGTRAPGGVFVTPGEPYACSATGRVGAAASATVGVEFEVATRLAILVDARGAGFSMSRSANAFGGCAPGTGPALTGALQIGASYRFGL